MDQQIIFEFGSIYDHFSKNEVSLSDISKIANNVQFYSSRLSIAAKKKILGIPWYVMNKGLVKLNCDEKNWASTNGDYFYGNTNYEGLNEYASLFASYSFTFVDMIRFFEFIMTHEKVLEHPFLSRNIEVTLRDYSQVTNQKTLNELGLIFAKELDEAFLL